jgi:hypothetical protein
MNGPEEPLKKYPAVRGCKYVKVESTKFPAQPKQAASTK